MTETTVPADQATGRPAPTRRQVLLTSGTVVVAAAVTAACGSSTDSTGTPAPTGTSGGGGGGSTAGSGSGGGTTVPTSDVPVGGGTILKDQKVVITQPQEGEFKAFTAVCTHQGCLVSKVADGNIDCACHGSIFSGTDGSVVQGPAKGALAPVDITVSGGTITLA